MWLTTWREAAAAARGAKGAPRKPRPATCLGMWPVTSRPRVRFRIEVHDEVREPLHRGVSGHRFRERGGGLDAEWRDAPDLAHGGFVALDGADAYERVVAPVRFAPSEERGDDALPAESRVRCKLARGCRAAAREGEEHFAAVAAAAEGREGAVELVWGVTRVRSVDIDTARARGVVKDLRICP